MNMLEVLLPTYAVLLVFTAIIVIAIVKYYHLKSKYEASLRELQKREKIHGGA